MSRNLKKLYYAFLLLALMIGVLGINTSSVQAASIKISKTQFTMATGTNYTLKVSGTKSTIKWSTSNKSIATVASNGKVTAKKKGSATITATVASKKYTCKLTVANLLEKYIYAKPFKVEIMTGAIEDLDGNIIEEGKKMELYFALFDSDSSPLGFNGTFSGVMWVDCSKSKDYFYGVDASSHTGLTVTSSYLDANNNIILNINDNGYANQFTLYNDSNYKKGYWKTTSPSYSEVAGDFEIIDNVEIIYTYENE